MESYNGWSNRSTWLVFLHLNNTNESVYKEALAIGKKYSEALDYYASILKRDSTSYSYPFHQVKACEDMLFTLLQKTPIFKENGFNYSTVNRKEILDALTD